MFVPSVQWRLEAEWPRSLCLFGRLHDLPLHIYTSRRHTIAWLHLLVVNAMSFRRHNHAHMANRGGALFLLRQPVPGLFYYDDASATQFDWTFLWAWSIIWCSSFSEYNLNITWHVHYLWTTCICLLGCAHVTNDTRQTHTNTVSPFGECEGFCRSANTNVL